MVRIVRTMLTAMQERFARAYVGPAAGNTAKAVRLSGSKARSPDSQSSLGRKWLSHPDVRKRIEELRNLSATSALLDREGRLRELEKIACDPNVAMTHRLRALDMLNRMHGDYDAVRAFEMPTATVNSVGEYSDVQLDYYLATSHFAPPKMSDEQLHAELVAMGYEVRPLSTS